MTTAGWGQHVFLVIGLASLAVWAYSYLKSKWPCLQPWLGSYRLVVLLVCVVCLCVVWDTVLHYFLLHSAHFHWNRFCFFVCYTTCTILIICWKLLRNLSPHTLSYSETTMKIKITSPYCGIAQWYSIKALVIREMLTYKQLMACMLRALSMKWKAALLLTLYHQWLIDNNYYSKEAIAWCPGNGAEYYKWSSIATSQFIVFLSTTGWPQSQLRPEFLLGGVFEQTQGGAGLACQTQEQDESAGVCV